MELLHDGGSEDLERGLRADAKAVYTIAVFTPSTTTAATVRSAFLVGAIRCADARPCLTHIPFPALPANPPASVRPAILAGAVGYSVARKRVEVARLPHAVLAIALEVGGTAARLRAVVALVLAATDGVAGVERAWVAVVADRV